METNESILTREIVSIDDRKKLGKMKELCVDCDTLSVCHYIVNSAATGSALVLPFEKSLAVGDTFMTVQSRDDFISPLEGEAKRVLDEGFRLVGVEVFSQNGNRLGVVESYEFDVTHGTVTKIVLGKRLAFAAETFVFFAPDFVFVDDGEATQFEMRLGSKAVKAKKKGVPRIFSKGPKEAVEKEEEFEAAPVVEEAAAEEVVEAPAVEAAVVDEDEVLKEFLINSVVSDDVESKDGLFVVLKGTVLTKEIVDAAQVHDALLLLTMSVES